MKARLLIALSCAVILSAALMGCASTAAAVDIDTTQLDEAAEKLEIAADKLTTTAEAIAKAKTEATSNTRTTHKILILDVFPTVENLSDMTQGYNALKDGGQITIKGLSEEEIEKAFGTIYANYRANDVNGYSFNRGNLLNYIASYGWELVTVETVGNNTSYYFQQ